jgi:hypothetical protein
VNNFQEIKKVSLKQPTAEDQKMIERVLVEAREAIALVAKSE